VFAIGADLRRVEVALLPVLLEHLLHSPAKRPPAAIATHRCADGVSERDLLEELDHSSLVDGTSCLAASLLVPGPVLARQAQTVVTCQRCSAEDALALDLPAPMEPESLGGVFWDAELLCDVDEMGLVCY
jgi:hypothetical protein